MKKNVLMGPTVHFGDDRDLVPVRYRDQIGRRYKSPHDAGHVARGRIVYAFAQELKARGETLTRDKLVRMLVALDRGYEINAQRLSFDLHNARDKEFAEYGHFNSHRINVEDQSGVTPYISLGDAARQRGCSKEAARKWLMLDGKPNRRGEIWTYVDPPHERSTVNARKKKP